MSYTAQEAENLRIITTALEETKNDHEKFFPRVFAEDVAYTISGYGPVARTYHGMSDLAQGAEESLFARFNEGLRIEVVRVWADGDTVLAWVRSNAEALDGAPYANEYMFVMVMKDGLVVSGIEWLDLTAYYGLLERISL